MVISRQESVKEGFVSRKARKETPPLRGKEVRRRGFLDVGPLPIGGETAYEGGRKGCKKVWGLKTNDMRRRSKPEKDSVPKGRKFP